MTPGTNRQIDSATTVFDAVSSTLADAKQNLQAGRELIETECRKEFRSARRYVRSHPEKSVTLAVVFGLLMGALIGVLLGRGN